MFFHLLLWHELTSLLKSQSGAVRPLKEITIGSLVTAGCVCIWCPGKGNVLKMLFQEFSENPPVPPSSLQLIMEPLNCPCPFSLQVSGTIKHVSCS